MYSGFIKAFSLKTAACVRKMKQIRVLRVNQNNNIYS